MPRQIVARSEAWDAKLRALLADPDPCLCGPAVGTVGPDRIARCHDCEKVMLASSVHELLRAEDESTWRPLLQRLARARERLRTARDAGNALPFDGSCAHGAPLADPCAACADEARAAWGDARRISGEEDAP